MATVQAYTKSGVDAKFNSRSNMTMVHNGGGSPDISAYPDSKTGDVIERSSDGARWGVVASSINPIAGRVVSVAGKTGVVTLGPGDVGAAPTSHAHTKAQITDLNASTSATANSLAQRGTGGVLDVGAPIATTHAATKQYVDDKVSTPVAWSSISGKPSTFAPSGHTHTVSQITDMKLNTLAIADTVVQRSATNQVRVALEPMWAEDAASKRYVETLVKDAKVWSAITGKPSMRSNVSGSTTNAGNLLTLSASGRLTAVNPSGPTDVANKQYVDNAIAEAIRNI